MVIHHVVFEDFGVYGGVQRLDLQMAAQDHYDRPIILFHGKNGVGKTSFVEGIRVALHGPLALGDRVSQKAYHEHLTRRIHRPSNPNASRPIKASVSITFDLVVGGKKVLYEVTRSWHVAGNGLVETVQVLEDGQLPRNVAPENFDPFLRDLVPPAASDLFFFDGEKIERLTNDEGADAILAEAVERLLGLHMVQQLDADLDVYIGRSAEQLGQQDLIRLQEAKEQLECEVADKRLKQSDYSEQEQAWLAAIARQEQELADKGGIYAKEYPILQKRKAKLQEEAQNQRRRLQDLTAGLLPFAAAPSLAQRVLARMDSEALHHQQVLAENILAQRRSDLLDRLAADAVWSDLGIAAVGPDQRQKIINLFSDALSPTSELNNATAEVFLQLSERERSIMQGQLAQALGPIANTFHDAARELDETDADLAKVEEELKMAPSDIILQPVFDTIQHLNAQLHQCREEKQTISEQYGNALFKLEQIKSQLAKAKEKQKQGEKVELAIRAQRAIRLYAHRLRARKVEALERDIVRRFNSLCRKGALLDAAKIDPQSFTITLVRNGELFKRNELSAGEKQLFALSTLWALREVAELPMPVVIDTPMGRLDSEHRLAMLRQFLPKVAHQVILLATDTEVDASVINELIPSVSHGYSMTYQPASGSTLIEPLDLETLFTLEDQVAAHS
jgi:DNA sulfur modification protein DndD